MKKSKYAIGLASLLCVASASAFNLGNFSKGLEDMQKQMQQQMQQAQPSNSGNSRGGKKRGIFEIAQELEENTKRGPVGRLRLGFDQIAGGFGGFSKKLSPEDPRSIYVGRILRTLALGGRMPYTYQGWTPILVEGPGDASAAAGGLVQVQSGIFGLVETEDELAGVLAHEMAHVELDASSYDFATKMSAKAFDEMTEDPKNPNTMGSAQAAYNFSTMRGFSTRTELEADERAIAVLKKAGYNPYGLCRVVARVTGEDINSVERVANLLGGSNRGDSLDSSGGTGNGPRYPNGRLARCVNTIWHTGGPDSDPGDSPKRTARYNKIVWNQ